MLIVSSVIVQLWFEKRVISLREGGEHAESQEPKTWERLDQLHTENTHTMAKKRFQQRGTSATPQGGFRGTVTVSNNACNFNVNRELRSKPRGSTGALMVG